MRKTAYLFTVVLVGTVLASCQKEAPPVVPASVPVVVYSPAPVQTVAPVIPAATPPPYVPPAPVATAPPVAQVSEVAEYLAWVKQFDDSMYARDTAMIADVKQGLQNNEAMGSTAPLMQVQKRILQAAQEDYQNFTARNPPAECAAFARCYAAQFSETIKKAQGGNVLSENTTNTGKVAAVAELQRLLSAHPEIAPFQLH